MQANFIEKGKGFSYSVLCPFFPVWLDVDKYAGFGALHLGNGGPQVGGAWVPNLPLEEELLKVGTTGFVLFICFPSSYLLSKETAERGGRS